MYVYDVNSEVSSSLKTKFPSIKTTETVSDAACQDIIFIALHPPVIMDTLNKIRDEINPRAIIISLAPKISIEKVRSVLGAGTKVIRMIPNATSYINEGYNPVCFSKGFEEAEKQEILKMLKVLGYTFEVGEDKLESYAIMSAMLPTYFWFQWKELAEIGQKIGLNENECAESIYDTLLASLDLFFKSGLDPDEVIDLIPVKPVAEHENQIKEFFRDKLLPLFEKIKP